MGVGKSFAAMAGEAGGVSNITFFNIKLAWIGRAWINGAWIKGA